MDISNQLEFEPGFDIMIMRMRPEHIPDAAAIEAELFSMPWSAQAFADALEKDYAFFYTALADGRTAGYCGLYLAADEGEITNVATAGAYRRRGIAEALVRRALSEAYEEGAEQIFLEVRRSNYPAVCLYEKIGFQAAGIRRGFYQFPAEDALVMVHRSKGMCE